ncbi:nickel-dependent hydrogenase large subunit [Candidatus Thiothrix sp. Deng01]|uniref:Nickel-dependent hydrogenase large subunit n=1 Tax=Candidatus Thiothrix phosphatis TaxID=3112415 RepID=A0ABU6CW24_9GAMM|nr:nickel-dependent hydrogenase large subunit [Candidatus Thiothrix sp. Deng01]MEB4590287.1 nickel-dependent hydrogenase large subunit [Candidatus Thiothrix sp. Deng01]
MTPEQLTGQLHIRLHWRQGKVTAVNIRSSRLRLTPHFFTGKPVAAAPELVGMLFTLCGTAQEVASARACEQASGQVPSPATELQRAFQVRTETLFEHLLRLCQDWPAVLGCEPMAATELQSLFKLKRELLRTETPEAVADEIRQWCESRLLGLPIQRWLDYCARGDAKKLSIRGKIGNLMSRLCRYDWEPVGKIALRPLPEFAIRWWEEKLTSTGAECFCAEPDVGGLPCETSSLTRQWENPALRVWRERYGSGLMTRLMARVLDTLACLEDAGPKGTAGKGIAILHTARGLLVHRVTQQNGLIQTYQIVAPTEWNFHPHGSLHHMLNSLFARTEEELRAQARTLITALDPCVDYQLEIIPDA